MPKAGGCSSSGVGRSSGGAEDLHLRFLKAGAAITLSAAGLFFSRLRSRQPRQHLLPPSGDDHKREEDSGDACGMKGGGRGLKEELKLLKNEDTEAKIINGNSVHRTTTSTMTTTRSTASVSLPPKCRIADDDEFLLPEFNEMVSEAFGREVGNFTTSRAPRAREDVYNVNEICKLRDMVRSLQERDKSLKLQLLELHGLQEQDAAVRDLKSQLKINNIESKLYSLKFDSLRSENQKLQTQLSENSKLISELERTRTKCKLLKKRLKLDAEQANDKIISLQKMVDSLGSKGTTEEKVNAEVQKKLERVGELENEARELRAANSRLQQEKSHLIRQLELTRLPPLPKSRNSMEVEALEDADRLRQENDKLTKEVEQLKTERFADVEELVYLKWINACLRHELRNKEASSGKTIARDLSSTMSPKSEQTVKQLIMEYANNVGADDRSLSSIDYGSEQSSSRASPEPDDTSTNMSVMTNDRKPRKKEKKRFFAKLRKLVLGKEKEKEKNNVSTMERRVSISNCSFERDSRDSFSSESAVSANQQHGDQGSSRHASGSQRSSHRITESGIAISNHSGVKNAPSGSEKSNESGHGSQIDSGEATIPQDVEIDKFADALITVRTGSSSSRRTTSFRSVN